MPPITVVVADQEQTSRAVCLDLLQPLKDVTVVGKVTSALGAVAAARLKPRVLLLDLNLTLSQGPHDGLLPAIRRQSPRTRVILLTRRVSERRILDALAQGPPGYLEKRALRTFLPKAVRRVAAGEAWVPRRMIAKIVDRLADLNARGKGAPVLW